MMAETPHAYRIDYEAPDVVDLMRQVRDRARAVAGDPAAATVAEDPRQRLRGYLELDDARPYELQRELGLEGAWNVTPEDLRASHPGGVGRAIGGLRRLLRPLTKLFANLDLPLYKQFKINLGLASALGDLLEENARLRARLDRLEHGDEASETAQRR